MALGPRDTTSDDFRYDVAVSFLSANEPIALRVSDGLSDRLTTFVYSREQPDVVGRNTDGVEAFTNAFRHESRVCVVLHSDGWGKKGYTQIEESAIKERALEHGWEFLIVVCLDDAKPPKWIPSTKIWYGYATYGIDGLLATIDNRVTELGGRPKQDAVLEKAARAQREADFEDEKQLFATSTAGFKSAVAEVLRMPGLLSTRVSDLMSVSPSLELEFVENNLQYRSFAAVGRRGSFVLYWQPQSSNSLRSAAMLIVEWGGRFSYGGMGGGPPKLSQLLAIPTIDYGRRLVWELRDTSQSSLTSEELFDYLFRRLLERKPTKHRPRGGSFESDDEN